MLTPIVLIRNATATGEDAGLGVRRLVVPAGQRTEAIRTILDALSRHLAGKEVLSREALARLIEDLALILKFPPLPQEGGRAFVRRLTAFLEAMPMPERLVLERQLAGRGLGQRVALLAAAPASRSGASPPDQSPIRTLPLAAPMPQSLPPVAKAPSSGDVALLQALLKKTFGTDEDARSDQSLEPRTAGGTDRAEAERGPGRSRNRASTSPGTGDAAAAKDAPGAAERHVAEPEAALPGGPAAAQDGEPTAAAAPRGMPVGEGSGPETPAPSAPENVESAAETEMRAAEADIGGTTDALDSDGTYGPPRLHREDDPPPVSRRGGTEVQSRSLSDALKTIIGDSVDLPGMQEGGIARVQKRTDAAGSAIQTTEPARPAGVQEDARPARGGVAGALPFLEAASADPAEDAPARDIDAAEPKGRRIEEEAATPQALARLVESVLPREAIPFALMPYPPASEAGEREPDVADGREQAGGENEAGTDEEDGDEAQEKPDEAPGSADATEEPDTAYGLYRKLGDLG